MTANQLQDRTFRFALDVLALCDHYPATQKGRAVAGQLVRAGTSVGANYRAARRARSRREFAATIAVVKTEADESEYWLEITKAARLVPAAANVATLLREATELRAIFVAMHATARKRARAAKRPAQTASGAQTPLAGS